MPAIAPLDSAELRRLVSPQHWPRLVVHRSVGSTNAELAELARAGADTGTVVATSDQTAGRGRRTRSWTTPPDVSLAFSALVQPPLPLVQWTWLPLLAGVAIMRAIAHTTGVRAELKWPNDVLIDDRKVCGVLVEQVATDDGIKAVVGCGINVSMDHSELPVPTATSLALAGAQVSMDDLLVGVLDHFADALDSWADDPGAFVAEYADACTSVGRRVRIQVKDDDHLDDPDAFVEGRATGVDAQGCLLVDVDGTERVFSAGDVVHLRSHDTSGSARGRLA